MADPGQRGHAAADTGIARGADFHRLGPPVADRVLESYRAVAPQALAKLTA